MFILQVYDDQTALISKDEKPYHLDLEYGDRKAPGTYEFETLAQVYTRDKVEDIAPETVSEGAKALALSIKDKAVKELKKGKSLWSRISDIVDHQWRGFVRVVYLIAAFALLIFGMLDLAISGFMNEKKLKNFYQRISAYGDEIKQAHKQRLLRDINHKNLGLWNRIVLIEDGAGRIAARIAYLIANIITGNLLLFFDLAIEGHKREQQLYAERVDQRSKIDVLTHEAAERAKGDLVLKTQLTGA